MGMILFISTRLMQKETILFTGPLHSSIHLQLLVWIGLETPNISELLIKLTLNNSMMLRIPNNNTMELLLFSMLHCGKLLHANLDGKLWEFSHTELMVLISIVSMLHPIEDLLSPEMIFRLYASITSQC